MDSFRTRLGDLLEPVPNDEVMPVDFSRRRIRIGGRAAVYVAVIAAIVCLAVIAGLASAGGGKVEMPTVEDAATPGAAAAGVTGETDALGRAGAAGAPGDTGSGAGADASAAVVSEPVPEFIVVSVVGLVHRPGLVTVAGTARVAEAIDAAGGLLPDANPASVNLAAPLRDGEQVLVGAEPLPELSIGGTGRGGPDDGAGAASAASGAGGTGGAGTGGSGAGGSGSGAPLVNINTASESELETVTGIGPATARKIIAHRERNGPFGSVDELEEVPGIGPAKLEGMRDEVTV